MTTEEPPKKQALNLCPWLVAGLAFALYAVTLNHWVTLASLPWVAKVTGWDWHPTYLAWRPTMITPLYSAITYPFKFLPQNIQPIGLNVLSAVMAALTLAILARSVRLFPHDRTREQRQREGGEYAMFSGPLAWLPATLAALALGLTITFWQNATVATNEMLDLLIFAYLIRCLLEYRISQNESWLMKFVFVYGLGITNNWALIGFFPAFLIALIWIKGTAFFNLRFLGRAIGLGVLGMFPYLVMAWVASSAYAGGTFWEQLRAQWAQQKGLALYLPRLPAIVLSVPTVVALLFAGIRWPSFHGEVSAAGIMFTNFVFRVVHIAFFALALVIFFDFKYSPHSLSPGVPMLSFYYLAALTVGYFSGYILLVFGRAPARVHEPTPGVLQAVKLLLFALPWIALIALPIGLVFGIPYKVREGNWSRIQAERAPVLQQFAITVAKSLPTQTAVVLSDDVSRLKLVKAGWQLVNKSAAPAFVETSSLPYGDYVRYMTAHAPQFAEVARDPQRIPKYLAPLGEIQVLQRLQQPIYYLEPSFGAFFERFYLKPAGVVFQLMQLEPHTLLAPNLTGPEIDANLNYWNKFTSSPLANLLRAAKKSSDAVVVAAQCSRAADYLGVELQRERRLNEAKAIFADALAINPQNVVAQVNQEFNAHLRAGHTLPVELPDAFVDEIKHYSWQGLIAVHGPVDEPELDFQFGQIIAGSGYLRQASELFLRRLALRPNDVDAQLAMAKTYVDMDQPDDAMVVLQQARQHAKADNTDELARIEALAWMAKSEFGRAEELLKTSAAKSDKQTGTRLSTLAEFYRAVGYTDLRNGRSTEAKEQFNKAIATLDQELRWLATPEHAATSDADKSDVMLRKSELQIQLGNYDAAVATLTQLLEMQPGSPKALMNRAIAQLRAGKYDAAKRDYNELDKLLPAPSYAVYFGLGEIASKTNDRSGAIRNFKRYLKYAPQNSDEAKQVRDRLQKLERGV